MSDAPRWPGADGSPGLDFGRKAVQPGAPGASEEMTTRRLANAPAVPPPGSDQGRPEFADQRESVHSDVDLAGITRAPKTPPAGVPQSSLGATTVSSGPEGGVGGADPAPQGVRARVGAALGAVSGAVSAETIPAMRNVLGGGSATESSTSTQASRPARGVRRTRKARLRISRFDPWSVMKTSFLFSIAFGVMTIAAVGVLWSVFAGSDTLTYINDLVNSVISDPQGGNRFDINEFLSWQRVMGLTVVLAALDIVIFTAVATLFAFLYNLASILMGGLEITLSED